MIVLVNKMKYLFINYFLILFIIIIPTNSNANNVKSLSVLLANAFLSQNLFIYCRQFSSNTIDDIQEKYGDISALTEHIRSEIISGLSADEVELLVRRSADAARAAALLAIRRFYEPDRAREQQRISEWCEKSVAPEVAQYMREHDESHHVFDKALSDAKKMMLPK